MACYTCSIPCALVQCVAAIRSLELDGGYYGLGSGASGLSKSARSARFLSSPALRVLTTRMYSTRIESEVTRLRFATLINTMDAGPGEWMRSAALSIRKVTAGEPFAFADA